MQLTMHYRRTSGLTAAHFDEVNLRSPPLVATLPFDQNRVPRHTTDQVLFRTKERWSWFAEAQKFNPALGTFFYLPPEVRSLVFKYVLSYPERVSTDGMFEYDSTLGSPFNLSAYYFGFGRRFLIDVGVMSLRLISSATKLEFEKAFLSRHTFRFNSAENLLIFFHRIKNITEAPVLSIDIGICPLYFLDPWMSAIMRLPPELLHIRFLLYPTFAIPKTEAKVQQALEYLEKLVERAAESSPHAKISIRSTTQAPLQSEFQAAADTIMRRLGNRADIKEKFSNWPLAGQQVTDAETFSFLYKNYPLV